MQIGGGPPTHVPPAHRSAVVQALLSLQTLVLLVKMQPLDVSQASSVHGLASLHVIVVPTHLPAEQ